MTRFASAWGRGLAAACLAWSMGGALAQAPVVERNIAQWLDRLHDASQRQTYVGTFVVSAGSEMATSKIWHVCEGAQQFERIEALTGSARTTLRRNDEVMTFMPDTRVAFVEKREALRIFPALFREPSRPMGDYYAAQALASDRVAGFDADVVDFVPKDAWRFGYRIWTERKSGLVLKLQTRGAQSQVLEQVAFTELQFNPAVSLDKMARQMVPPPGYQVIKPAQRKTTPEAEGWRVKSLVPGFQAVSCHTRSDAVHRQPAVLQCVFSDGLAAVSWFVEPLDGSRHLREQSAASGATHYLSQRLGKQWVTVMGEVPTETLRQFAQALEPTR